LGEKYIEVAVIKKKVTNLTFSTMILQLFLTGYELGSLGKIKL
jgi:hypothetical protein